MLVLWELKFLVSEVPLAHNLNPKPCTPHPAPLTLNTKRSTLNQGGTGYGGVRGPNGGGGARL